MFRRLLRPPENQFRCIGARSSELFSESDELCRAGINSELLTAPRRRATRIALHTRAIPQQRKVPAFAAHLAFVAFCLGFGAAFGFRRSGRCGGSRLAP